MSIPRRTVLPMLAAAAAPPRPNIVMIVADDLGWNDVGYHGGAIRTPHLDRLAAQGVQLDRFYAAPVCSPTRAGLLTGRYPIRYGMMHWPIAPYDVHGLPSGERTLAALLGRAGYARRAAVGKWHLGHARPEHHPLSHGFTGFYGYYNSAIDHFTHLRDGQRDWHRDWSPSADEGYATDLEADEAIRFLRVSPADQPFFLYLALNAPHTPLQAPADAMEPYRDWPEPRRTYAAMVTRMDQAVGRVLQTLEATGLSENTLLLFLSDNGGDAGAGGNNAPLRGNKATVFEGGIRVPAIIRWPRGLMGGRICRAPLRYIDMVPTLGRLAGVPFRGGPALDGVDVWESIRDADSAGPQSLYSFVGSLEREHLALTESGWKLIRVGPSIIGTAAEAGVHPQLFQIEDDPLEKRDLAGEHPKRVLEMLGKLRDFRRLHPAGVRIHTGGDANRPPGWVAPENWTLRKAR